MWRFQDSFRQLRVRDADELRGRLTVQFQGEEGIDAGGVTREWYGRNPREPWGGGRPVGCL